MKGPRSRKPRRPRQPVPPEAARSESRRVDFKESLDVASPGEWVELIKDIVTMANSGGGALVIGVNNDGAHSGADCGPLLKFDPAKIVDKIAVYTVQQFADFEVRPGQRAGKPVAVIDVQPVFPPLVFVRPGTYPVTPDGTKQKTAFGVGTVYFRHGAKSEPANSHDLKDAFDRRLAAERRNLLSNVRKVVHMPTGGEVRIIPGDLAKPGDTEAVPVRLVDDPRAPVVRALDADQTHPYRQTELLAEMNKRLAGKVKVNGFDIQCVRQAHKIDKEPAYCHKPKFATRQYSETFCDWMVGEYTKDNGFFTAARGKAYKEAQKKASR
jgi:hypothetical protein